MAGNAVGKEAKENGLIAVLSIFLLAKLWDLIRRAGFNF